MSTGSTVPAALAALVEVFGTAGVTGVEVIDGPDYDSAGNYLAVGWDRSDEAAVQLNREHQDAAGSRKLETYTVSCLLSLQDGDATVQQVREAAYAAFGLYDTALSANRRLGSNQIVSAEITDHEYTPTLIEVGAACDLRFTVQVQAIK